MELENKEEFEQIIKENEYFMAFFYSTWCPPCRMLRPIIEEYIENNIDNLIICVNTDQIKDLHKSYGITNVPTILCFKNGDIVDTIDGFIEYEEIEEKYINLKS